MKQVNFGTQIYGNQFRVNQIIIVSLQNIDGARHTVAAATLFQKNRQERMNDFFKHVLATVVGIVAFFILMGALGLMSIVGMVASSSSTVSADDNSVLVLPLSGNIVERSSGDELNSAIGTLTGSNTTEYGLNDMIQAIDKAKRNDNVKGIYIEAGDVNAGLATLQELRSALVDFRKSGKWIVSYGDSYSQGAYYVASVANKIFINPEGMLDWHGIGAEPYYLKDFFAKFGVKYQVFKVGTFKSATENFTEDHMSDANRLQMSLYVEGAWRNVCQAVSMSRNISVDSLGSYADQYLALQPTTSLQTRKMVDGLMYADKVKDEVKKMLNIAADEHISQLSVSDMLNVKDDTQDSGDEIAIYYASGDIVQSANGVSQGASIVMDKVCRDLTSLADNDNVKAVVLRINSGGGDAFASEQIWHKVMELKAKKPVVVSMGDYAASGAYYMSAPANWIVAEPNTLTGSIGIFALIPDMSGLITQKLGVKFDAVKTNRNTLLGSMSRPFNAEESAIMQSYVNRGYKLFRSRVVDGRRLPVDSVEKIAQGRVWIGSDALRIKLVDQLGTLGDAVAKAAALAKVSKYHTTDYPATASWLDQLFETVSPHNYLDEQMRATMGELYEPFMLLRNINNREALQARLPFAIGVRN